MSRESTTTSSKSPGLLSSLVKRGWKVTRLESKTLPKILDWSWPFTSETPALVPVHVLVGKENWLQAAWMLASWFHFTEMNWSVVLHDDGTLPKEADAALTKMFGTVRLIPRSESDAALKPVLNAYPFCAEYRLASPLSLKVLDIPHFAKGQRFLVFDSQLLFLNYPHEIVEWVRSESDEIRFAEDAQENSPITANEIRSELNLKILPRVDSGVGLLNKAAIDLDLCDRALAQTSLLTTHVGRAEQTLFMLCGSNYGKAGLLPRTYEVSHGKAAAPVAVARHYVGPVHDQFYSEGLAQLSPILFPRDAA